MSFNTFIKAVEILDLFLARKTALGAVEISESLGIPRSTTYKYLSILKEYRFLDYDSATNKFSLGFKFFEFGALVQSQITIDKIALPVMTKLYEQVKETVILSALIHNKAYCLERVGNESGIVFVMQRGSHLPLHCGASSLVLLAFSEDDFIEQFLQTAELKKYTANTITEPKRLRKRLAAIRKAGYACSDQEVDIGGRAISAPIFNHLGRIHAGLGVVGPIQRMTDEKIDQIKDLVIQYTHEITMKYQSSDEP
jgi:IclR family KDG regulon transcriptional repressor